MKKHRLSRILAVFLSLLILMQSFGLAAFAADGATRVVIPSGSDEATVNHILTAALLGEDAEDQAWEYYCEGKTSLGISGNKSWGTIAGFTTETGKLIKTTYTHPALADNEDADYQVRITGTEDVYTIEKRAKLDSSVTLNGDVSVVMPYLEDSSVDYDALQTAIFQAMEVSSEPELSLEDVSISYYATSAGAVGNLGTHAWVPLTGGTVSLVKYPAISEGTWQIQVKWDGNDTYFGATAETTVTLTGRQDAVLTLNENPTAALNAPDLKAAIFDALVQSVEPELTPEDVTIEYATKTLGITSWNDLSGLTETGTYTVRMSWGGNSTYNGFTVTAELTVVSGLNPSSMTLNSDVSVPMVYDDNAAADIASTKAAIYEAVVASCEPELSLEDVTLEYYATSVGTVGSLAAHAWVPLEGGTVSLVKYPAISEGTQTIRISWNGNEEYDGFGPVEAAVTITSRPDAPYTLKEPADTVKLVYTDDQTVDYSTIEQDVFAAVIAESDALTPENVTIEYFASLKTGSLTDLDKAWVPLTGGTGLYAGYPAIAEGSWNVRISYPGSREYAATTLETTITVAGRDPMTFTLNDGPYEVGMVFDADQNYDFAATAQAIYNAVVASTEPQVAYDEITVEFNTSPSDTLPIFQPLDYTIAGKALFGEGTWTIRLSWGGNRDYAPGSVTVSVTVSDSRTPTEVILKDGVSFTYNKDVAVIKQYIFDNCIDWESSALPAKETLSIDDFTFEYQAQLSLLDGVSSDIADKVIDQILGNSDIQTAYVPFEGKTYELAGQVLGKYPPIGAGEQQIRITYHGSAEYKPSNAAEGTVSIQKASVKVKVKSASVYVSKAADLDMVTTDPEDDFNMYVVYAGITSNVTTGIYLELPEAYTSNSTLIKIVDKVLAGLNQPTLTELLQNGITVGELREMLNATEVIEALEKLGIDTGSLGQLIKVINQLPAVGDNLRIAFGKPNRAGIYAVTAISDNKNYNTGVGVGALVLKADKAKLTWNQDISKLTAEEAQTADFGASITVNGEAVKDQSSVHVLYSGFTSKWKPYSSTTTPPTEPGRYVMTVVVLGGNYSAAPITRTFQITK